MVIGRKGTLFLFHGKDIFPFFCVFFFCGLRGMCCAALYGIFFIPAARLCRLPARLYGRPAGMQGLPARMEKPGDI